MSVLGIVYYRIPLPPDGIARTAKGYEEDGDGYGSHSLPDYLRAVEGCIAKGWLTILSAEDLEREAQRRRRSAIPELSDGYLPGAVEFTPAGFALHQDLLEELYGLDFLDHEYSGWDWDREARRIDVFATDEDGCLSLLRDIQGDVAWYVGGAAQVQAVEGPRPIGYWKPSRFITVPGGFHAAVEVELLG
jgi:hypothetical protein